MLRPSSLEVERKPVDIRADSRRVILKPFIPHSRERIRKILQRVLSLEETLVEKWLEQVIQEFADRHSQFLQVLKENYHRVAEFIPAGENLSEKRKYLIGAYFTHEYSVEAAALFNPSIVPHPDQTNLPHNHLRFILSLRATGEGHISSIEFRSGVLDDKNQVKMDDPTPFLLMPRVEQNAHLEKELVKSFLKHSNLPEDMLQDMITGMPDSVPLEALKKELKVRMAQKERRKLLRELEHIRRERFDLKYDDGIPITERIIFPVSEREKNGIEDARFVAFEDEQGLRYYAPYTAYDGQNICMKLIETADFLHFKIFPFLGPAVQNKGLALFPHKIGGKFAAVSRQDGESLFLMYSESLYYWESARIIRIPNEPWEMIQIGNCGSPIKIKDGWLLLTHGVGPLRKYVISAFLLDEKDPSRIIGALKEPILSPNATEREGYVPNVVYSCGGLVHQGELILPYAYSDIGAGIASISLTRLLNAFVS